MIDQLANHVDRYRVTVDKLPVVDWVNQKAASMTYLQQQELVIKESKYLKLVAGRLSATPEKLTLVMDMYFRLQALEGKTAALVEGASKFDKPETAEALQKLVADNSETRVKLRKYMVDLAANKEAEYAIAEREAMRCQAELNRNPLAPVPPMGPKPTPQEKK